MKKRVGTTLIVIGILFLLNAIFGRYIVLPGYMENQAAGNTDLTSTVQNVAGWYVARYLIWAYSFKIGIFFIVIGACLWTAMKSVKFWLFTVVGLIYVGFAYMPLPTPGSIVFGIAGGIMTILIILIILRWAKKRDQLPKALRRASDYRMAGYFFFAMATYTLCPLLGVRTFALQPEKMIEYGLQADAGSFAFHVLIELVLGWIFIFIASQKEKQIEGNTANAKK